MFDNILIHDKSVDFFTVKKLYSRLFRKMFGGFRPETVRKINLRKYVFPDYETES